MLNLLSLTLLLLLSAALASAQDDAPPQVALDMAEFVPELTDEVLLNPRMGLYLSHPALEAEPDDWTRQVADIAYYRLGWSTLNPEEGVYAFDEYFQPIFDFWVDQHGKRVAFGVMSQSKHSREQYVTPQWVFDRGVPGVTHIALRGHEQVNPVFWDDRYLDLYCEFIRRLGEYLDGREGFEFIDIRGIGEWGEMHLQRWTPEQLEQTGYSDTRYIAAYRRQIDAFAEAFPHSQVFLNVGGRKFLTIMDYAAIRGIHFRQDGLSPSGASHDVGEWLYKPYSRRGVICNFEFHSGYQSMQQKGWDLGATIERGLQAPISYLNTNLGRLRELPDEVRELLTYAARRVGYRFVMTGLQYLPEFHLDGERPARIPLISTWRNDGVAPCYDSFALRWSLESADGEAVASALTFPEVPTTQWWPGEEQSVRALLRVPADAPQGRYRLRVAMILPETGGHILLGLAGRDDQDRYELLEVAGVPGEGRRGMVYEQGFEGDAQPWGAARGMTATVDDGDAHTGGSSLLVEGTHEQGWNYSSFRVPEPLLPASKYRLSAWLLVEQIEPAGHSPYLKIGVNDPEGAWVENHGTARYDLSAPGTWQRLEVFAEVPMNAGSAHLAIEKGAYSTPITTRIRLDDVKLELLEAP